MNQRISTLQLLFWAYIKNSKEYILIQNMENPETSKTQGSSQTLKLQQTCASCATSGSHLMRCSRCKKVFYCNVDCQRAHFKQHKLICTPAPVEIKPPEPKPFGIDDFLDLEHVGTGNFSMIFKGRSKVDNKVYAIKQVEKMKLKRLEKQADIIMEKHCLQKLKNWPFAVQIERTFQDEVSLYIQMQFAERGQLWDQSRTFGTISEAITRYYFFQIVKALQELHNKFDIVHRDIKPQNILLTNNYEIKFVDFGTSKDLSRPDLKGSGNGLKKRKVFEHYIGTPNYMPPECIHNIASEKVSDVYALGGVFYFLKTGYPPFTGGSEYLIFTKSTKNPVYIPEGVFDKDEEDLLSKMLQKDHTKRVDINKVLSHQYFSNRKFPSSHQEAMNESSKQQIYLMQLSKQVLKFCNKFQQPVQQRRRIYGDDVLPIFVKYFQERPSELDKELVYGRMKRMLMGAYCMLNVEDDNSISFQEVHRKHKDDNKFDFSRD